MQKKDFFLFMFKLFYASLFFCSSLIRAII